jgi:hypothetical protein
LGERGRGARNAKNEDEGEKGRRDENRTLRGNAHGITPLKIPGKTGGKTPGKKPPIGEKTREEIATEPRGRK